MTLPPPSSTPPPPPSTPRRDLLLAIRAFAAGQYEVLGELGLDERGDLLFLARAIDDGALVGLRVEAPGRALRDGRTVADTMELVIRREAV